MNHVMNHVMSCSTKPCHVLWIQEISCLMHTTGGCPRTKPCHTSKQTHTSPLPCSTSSYYPAKTHTCTHCPLFPLPSSLFSLLSSLFSSLSLHPSPPPSPPHPVPLLPLLLASLSLSLSTHPPFSLSLSLSVSVLLAHFLFSRSLALQHGT
jgi:hypothetical protein